MRLNPFLLLMAVWVVVKQTVVLNERSSSMPSAAISSSSKFIMTIFSATLLLCLARDWNRFSKSKRNPSHEKKNSIKVNKSNNFFITFGQQNSLISLYFQNSGFCSPKPPRALVMPHYSYRHMVNIIMIWKWVNPANKLIQKKFQRLS